MLPSLYSIILTYPHKTSPFLVPSCIDHQQRNRQQHVKQTSDRLLSVGSVHDAQTHRHSKMTENYGKIPFDLLQSDIIDELATLFPDCLVPSGACLLQFNDGLVGVFVDLDR